MTIVKNKIIDMFSLNGQLLRTYKNAREAADELGVHYVTIYSMVAGRIGKTYPFTLVYRDCPIPVYKPKAEYSAAKTIREIKDYQFKINGIPVKRNCIKCGKEFKSKHKANRRCEQCNWTIENELKLPKEYKCSWRERERYI